MKRTALSILLMLAAAVLAPIQPATASTTCTPTLQTLSAPSLVYVGDSPEATVRLSCAPTSSIQLTVTSGNSKLSVPASVAVSANHDSVAIPLTPTADSAGQYSSTVTVSYGTNSLNTTITVDPGLAGFQLNVNNSEPNSLNPTFTFTGPAPTGGLTVQVASDSPDVTVPATVSSQQYSYGGGFNATTVQTVKTNTTVTLSVTLGSRTIRASTVLLPPFSRHDSMTLSAQTQPGVLYGQEFYLEYAVALSNPAPATGVNVTVTSHDPSVELQSTTNSVTVNITPGFTTGYFTINTANVTKAVHTQITASADGVEASIPVTIEPTVASVTMPASVRGGTSFTGTVNLAGPADVPTSVYLQSTWGILQPPSTPVIIPAGKTSASFTVTTSTVTSNSDVSITAYLAGNAVLTSNPVTLTP